jgi:hypothetical protein
MQEIIFKKYKIFVNLIDYKNIHIFREDLRGIWSKAKNRISLTNVLCKEPILRYCIALGA